MHVSTSQTKKPLKSNLENIVHNIEQTFNIHFSYESSTLNGKIVQIPNDLTSFNDIIERIEDQTSLIIKKVNKHHFLIKENKSIIICGYLKSIEDKLPMEGVNILNKTKAKGIITDKNGFFQLENNNNYDSIVISFIGFKKTRFLATDLKKEKCSTINLIPQNINLNKVVINDSQTSKFGKLSEVSTLFNSNLTNLPEQDILSFVQQLPGIESTSETVSNIMVRGSNIDQNLILWDGIKIYKRDHLFGALSSINPHITETINIYKSGVSSFYNGGVGGVIDAKSSNIIPERTEGSFGMNMLYANADVKLPISNKLAFLFSARRSLIDVFSTPTYDNLSERIFQKTGVYEINKIYNNNSFSETQKTNYFIDNTFKFIFEPSKKDKITSSSIYSNSKYLNDVVIKDNETDLSNKLNTFTFGSILNWKRFWSSNFSTDINMYLNTYDFDYKGVFMFSPSEINTEIKKNTIHEEGFKIHTKWKLNKLYTLSSGYQFTHSSVSYTLNSAFLDFQHENSNKGSDHALYTQMEYNDPKKLYVSLGVRANKFPTTNKILIEPRVFLKKQLNNRFSLKASAENRNQYIGQIIDYSPSEFGLENNLWIFLNDDDDDIPNYKIDQFSIGFTYEKNNWFIDFDTYFKKSYGLTSLAQGFQSSIINNNVGSSTSKGIELFVKKEWTNYTSWFNYNYSDTNYIFDDLNNGTAFRGNGNTPHSISFTNSLALNKLTINLSWKYRTGIPYTNTLSVVQDEENAYFIHGAINTASLPDYHRLDTSISYHLESKKHRSVSYKLLLSVLNIYDKKNILNREYNSFLSEDGESYIIQPVDYKSLGITPNLSFQINF
ncbi:carboxypeptidase-like regulatory domain-containing protein [Flavivirga abyssicola]|uniref:TonB-dependent receptor n=1 Tax=Flavivirga abyssicola TaxID=3063533 RepID=UPI0026DF9777|nr:carboxypeptidase-like regulatory domain-containing protein [Flavivirga sp. MEBiC07777]WVK12640.1 carboxypeptidase-like regulatory domain-containing protein [Flavivirga sp. MEBiC07777]